MVEALLPDSALAGEPTFRSVETGWRQPVGPGASVLVRRHQTRPLSTARCWVNEGNAMANGSASSDVDAGPDTSRSIT